MPRPAFVAPGRALTGLLAELEAFLARRIGVVQLLARDEEPAQRPPEAPDGIFPGLSRPFGCGFSALPWNVVSPPSETPRLAFGRSWAIPGATPRDAVGRSWVQSRASRARGSRRPLAVAVVQLRPGQLDLLQLAQTVLDAEVLNGACLVRGRCPGVTPNWRYTCPPGET